MQPESLSRAIQMSVAPVFLLAGIGALMNVFSGRLSRIVDTVKASQNGTGKPMDELTKSIYRQRMKLTIRGIGLLVMTSLLIAAVVAVMFLSVVFQLNLAAVVVPIFIVAMLLLMLASTSFLREVRLASVLINKIL